jgi:hypothetical protein
MTHKLFDNFMLLSINKQPCIFKVSQEICTRISSDKQQCNRWFVLAFRGRTSTMGEANKGPVGNWAEWGN